MSTEQMQTERDIWRKRYEALDRVIAIVRNRIKSQGLARARTMELVLDQLRDFGEKQFDFFFYDRNFQPDDNYHHALQSLDTIPDDDLFSAYKLSYPIHDYALSVTLNQIATDIAELQRRQEEQAKAGNNEDNAIAATLRLADWLALQALKPFVQNIGRSFTALTIIQKSSFARIFPYVPVALVGIPYSAIEVELDFLTIPHEVAHFIYWHGKANDGQYLRKKLDDAFAGSPLATWSEEIFADVVGLLIGGPIMAQTIQQMMKKVIAEPFDSDDGIHPTPRVRPYIHLDLLKRLVGSENDHYKKLAANWASVEASRPLYGNTLAILGKPMAPRFRLLRSTVPVVRYQFSPEELRGLLSDSITKVLALFPDWEQVANSGWTTLNEPSPLAEQLSTYIESQRPPDLLDIDDAEFTIIDNQLQWQNYSWKGLVKVNYDLVLHENAGSVQNIKPETWVRVLSFDGWTTEGPGPGQVTNG